MQTEKKIWSALLVLSVQSVLNTDFYGVENMQTAMDTIKNEKSKKNHKMERNIEENNLFCPSSINNANEIQIPNDNQPIKNWLQ